jgi:hypothetical protein
MQRVRPRCYAERCQDLLVHRRQGDHLLSWRLTPPPCHKHMFVTCEPISWQLGVPTFFPGKPPLREQGDITKALCPR